jgi:hypothetical protein
MLEGQFERDVDVQVPKNSTLYIDIDSVEMRDFMDDYDWQRFYDEMGSNPFIEEATEDTSITLHIYSKFYVYHSATGTLELHTTKELENGTLDITGLVTSGYYYGGYYKACPGVGNKVQAAADANNSEGTLSSENLVALSNCQAVRIPEFVPTTADKYDPVNNAGQIGTYFTRANAFTTAQINARSGKMNVPDSAPTDKSYDYKHADGTVERTVQPALLREGGTGTAMTPARACIYYLCEVPGNYLASPKVSTIKENYGKGAISLMSILSVTDTSLYRTGGEKIGSTDTKGVFATTYTLQKQDQGTGTTTSTTVASTDSIMFGLNGRLTVTDGSACKGGGTFTLEPYWITYDNVIVRGGTAHTRTITVSGNTVT